MARTKKVKKENEEILATIKNIRKKPKRPAIFRFSRYIYKVFRASVPRTYTSISVKSMSVMQDFTLDLLERLARGASSLVKADPNRITLQARDIKYALKLLLPGELCNYVIAYAENKIKLYYSR